MRPGPRPIDLLGQRFGRLLVVKESDEPGHWVCVCDCGNTKTTTSANLRGGATRSCGCLRREVSSARASRRGQERDDPHGRERKPQTSGRGVVARPRFLLAICRDMRWVDGGVFATEPEAQREQRIVKTLGTADTRVLKLRGREPRAVLARLKRSLVIVRQGAERKLLIGFYCDPPHPNPNLNLYRRPIFKPRIDVSMVVKFETVPEARACLEDVRAFVPDAIAAIDWQEET